MLDKTTILIVDDTPGNIFVLEKLLADDDRTLLSASTGYEALRIALSKHPDLIILDVQMPGMDGFEVAQILRSNKKTKDIPIIFASATKKEQHFIMKGFEEGAVDYLLKPLDPEITKAKVAVLLKLQLQKRELIEKNLSLKKAEEEIKKLNIDLQINLSELESANKELESFSYSVSHDLRAPLRALNQYSKMLAEDYGRQLDDEGRTLIGNVSQNAAKMDRLINDLLEFSKLGRKELGKHQIDMEGLVQNVIEDLHDEAKYKTEIIINSLLPARADGFLLTQVWANLVSNAIKYSSKKDKPEIEIGCHKSEGEVIYYIKDNGVGFSMDYANKLFGVFQRLHSGSDFEGTGIGLAIVQRIVTRHGGKVWVEAEENVGAKFYFSLPTY